MLRSLAQPCFLKIENAEEGFHISQFPKEKSICSELKAHLSQFTLLLHRHRHNANYCIQREAKDVDAQCKIYPLLGGDSKFISCWRRSSRMKGHLINCDQEVLFVINWILSTTTTTTQPKLARELFLWLKSIVSSLPQVPIKCLLTLMPLSTCLARRLS